MTADYDALPAATPDGWAEPIYRAHIKQVMALEYVKFMAGSDDPLTMDEASDFARATWETEWDTDPAPRTVEQGIVEVGHDLSYWGEE